MNVKDQLIPSVIGDYFCVFNNPSQKPKILTFDGRKWKGTKFSDLNGGIKTWTPSVDELALLGKSYDIVRKNNGTLCLRHPDEEVEIPQKTFAELHSICVFNCVVKNGETFYRQIACQNSGGSVP